MSEPVPLDAEILFAQLLVRQKLAKPEHVHECLRILTDLAGRGVNPLPKLGEVMVQRGYLTPADLERTTRRAPLALKISKKSDIQTVRPSSPIAGKTTEAQFAMARRAVDFGWVTKEQVEAAIVAHAQDSRTPIFAGLPLTPEQVRELDSIPAGPVPPEAVEAMRTSRQKIGRYWVMNQLGSGGMGTVYRAWDPQLGRWVALKVLKQFGDESARAYFQREARLAAGLAHPSIAAIYEVGEQDGVPFIAMQYIEGTTLEKVSSKDRRVIAEALRQSALAVHFAHEQGVIHRDLKPANIMVIGGNRAPSTRRVPGVPPVPKIQAFVMDFGLAKSTNVNSSLSASGLIVGTPSYMSPEQARGELSRIDARSDVYSLGASLYHLLTGQPPFVCENVYDIVKQVVEKDPRPPRCGERDLETITMKCLEKDPTRRYPNALELAEDLDRWLAGEAILAHPPSIVYRVGKRLRREKKFSGAIAALVVLLLAAGIGVPPILKSRRQAERRAAALKEIEEARIQYEAGHFEACLGHAHRAQELRPDLPGGWYWEARCSIHDYARYQRLPTPWISEGRVEFLPPPEEPAPARLLREHATDRVDRMRSLAHGELEGWEEPGALGIVAVLQGRYEVAERELSSCLKDPRADWDTEAKHYLALCRYFQHRFGEASDFDQKILGTDAGVELRVRALQGAALQDGLSGLSSDALKRLATARAFAMTHRDGLRGKLLEASVLVSRGDILARIGRSSDAQHDFDEAWTAADEAIRSATGTLARDAFYERAEAAMGIAHLDERRGRGSDACRRAREAIYDYSEALKRDDRFLAACFRRALARFLAAPPGQNRNDPDYVAALADLDRFDRLSPGPLVRLVLAKIQSFGSYMEGVDQQIRSLDDVILHYPDYLPAYLERARRRADYAQVVWESQKQDPTPVYQKAVDDCAEAIRRSPGYAEAYFQRAFANSRWGDYLLIHGQDPSQKYEECFADIERALKINPELYEACLERAAKRLSMGVWLVSNGKSPESEWQAAIADYDRVLAINPEALDSYVNRSKVRRALGDYYERTGHDPFRQYELGLEDCEKYHGLGRQDSALSRALGELHIAKGFAHARRNQKSEAVRHLEAGIGELTACIPADVKLGMWDTHYREIFFARGQARCALGRHLEAQKDFDEAVRRGLTPAQAWLDACRNH